MSTQTTAERSRKVISASHDQSQHDAFLFVVMRAVGESLSIARRTHEGVTEQLPIITMERDGGAPWRVEFDALDVTDSQRANVEDAVAKAYDEPWNREAVCLLVQPGDSLDDKPLAHLAAHANELHKALTAYIDEVNAGACPVATLAAHLQRTGAKGVELAAVTVDTYTGNPARLLFNANAPGLAVFPYYFALALWHDVIQPRAEATAIDAKTPPILKEPIFDDVMKATVHARRKIVTNPNQLMLFVDGELVGTAMEAIAVDSRVTDAFIESDGVLGGANGQRLLRWLVKTVKHQRIMKTVDSIHEPGEVNIEGGYKALAEAIGATYNTRVAKELRDILAAGSGWRLRIDGSEFGGLWTYRSDEATGQRRGYISIRVAAVLDHNYRSKSGTNIHVVLLPFDGGLDGITNANNIAKLAAFRQKIVRFMTARRVEYGEKGGVLITPQDFRNMAADVGLSEAIAFRGVQSWSIDRPEGEALFSESGGVYGFAKNETYRVEVEHYERTVKLAFDASVSGKKGVAVKAKKKTAKKRATKK